MTDHADAPAGGDRCDDCALGRRVFLRNAALSALAIAVGLPRDSAAMASTSIGTVMGRWLDWNEKAYPIPATDGASIDRDEDVILVRHANRVYAFALSCPHQNTALRWTPQDGGRFECPKHHSKYQPDGTFISGRATRSMDRFALRREGDTVHVDLAVLYEQDRQPTEWAAAQVTLT